MFDVAITTTNAVEFAKPIWKSQAEKNGVKIELKLNVSDHCFVRGNEDEIFEAIVDLIKNASEALPDGGNVQVRTFAQADEVLIQVGDDGMGIPADELPKLFQPFWSTRGVAIGKGMGLAVVHGLIKRHGGVISVQSKDGDGATFTIRLPLAKDPIEKTEQPTKILSRQGARILVIDDDETVAGLLEKILATAGHEVFKSYSGADGLDILQKESIDFIICDLGMPGLNGRQVGAAVQSWSRKAGVDKPPFLLLTGWGEQDLKLERIAASGTDAIAAKPINSATLLRIVREMTFRNS